MSNGNQNTQTGGDSANQEEMVKLPDYAWKWFEYHAKQRISMFNYFLVASGILAHAYVNLICEKCFILAVGLALIGTVVSFCFVMLDFRNAQLVYWGEDLLRRMEQDSPLIKSFKGLSAKGCTTSEGILLRDLSYTETRCTKHKIWLRVIEFSILGCFFVAAIASALWRYFDC